MQHSSVSFSPAFRPSFTWTPPPSRAKSSPSSRPSSPVFLTPFPHFLHTPAALKLLQKAYPTLAPLLLLGAVRRLSISPSDSFPEPAAAAAVTADPADLAGVEEEEEEEEGGAPLPQRPPSAFLAWVLRLLPR